MEESGGLMLMGEFNHSIDDKNRLIIPSKLRNELGNEAVITRGLDKCLFIYSKKEWESIVSKLSNLPFTKKSVRDFNRFFLSSASTIVFDKMGRVNLSQSLLNYANLTKECVIIGVNDRVEVWDKNEFDTFISSNLDNFSDMAENLFEGGQDA